MKSRHANWTTMLAVLIALAAVSALFANPASAQQRPAATAKASSAPAGAKPAASEEKTAGAESAARAAPGGPAANTDSAAKATEAKPAETKPAEAKAAPSATKPAPVAPESPAPRAGHAPEAVDAATYTVRLRDLESRVDELKEQIRRSHTRLSLLSDTILSGGIGGAQAEIVFRNDMSNAFRVTQVLIVLDGAVQYKKKDDTGVLSGQKEIPIFSGAVPPGDHTLQVVVGLQGHGYGVFSYLRGYKFEVKSTHSFTVSEGKTAKVEVVAWEKGGVTTPLEQRPSVRFAERIIGSGASAEPGAK